MSTITLRLVKGAPLTNQEVDDNFANLNNDKYEAGDSASLQDLTLTGMSGPIAWNVDDGALDIPLNDDVTLQTGQEFVFYAKATEAISNGDVVMFAGAQGGHLLIAKADMSATGFDPTWIVGVATQDFANNEFGYATSLGKVRGLDTSALSEGDILYVDPTTAGAFTTTKPSPPNHIIQIAAVVYSHGTQGTIQVRVTHIADTDEVPEGSTNLYFTDARAVAAIKADADWNATNWNTAHGWGNHASAGYALADNPVFTGTPHVDSTTAVEMPTGTTAQRPTPVAGMFRFNSEEGEFEGYNGTEWGAIAGGGELSFVTTSFVATAGQTTFTVDYTVGLVQVFLNGVKLLDTDYTATNGTSIILDAGASAGDEVDVISYEAFAVADTYTQAQADNKFATSVTVTKSGGGTLDYAKINILTDTNTYTLPLANSVDSGDYIEIELPDTYKTFTPTVACAGSDNIRYSEGTDTSIVFNAESSVSLRLVSNGTNEWSF
jgi:hypothetical protein